MSNTTLADFVAGMSQRAKYLFVTDLDTDFYESFGPDWETFMDVMPT